ncbi:MAG: NAD+ synthase [Thiotrichales bacterium]
MADSLKIALGQINMIVGDADANADKVIEFATRARDELHADLIVFPELTLTGYPPEDLLLRDSMIEWAEQALFRVAAQVRGIDVVVGLPWKDARGLRNAACVVREGRIIARYFKQYLPNYLVFDEKRYFKRGRKTCIFDCKGVNVAVTICEDIWREGPAREAKLAGAELVVNLNASPYHRAKQDERVENLRFRVEESGLPIVYVNAVGGQDELVFDGQSMVINASGKQACQGAAFVEDLAVANFPSLKPCALDPVAELESVYQALVLGVRDYVTKNGFKGALLGLSGGIDSALTLAVAVDALGADNVNAVMMPSRYTSRMSLDDAAAQARAMGVEYEMISIEPAYTTFMEMLAPSFKGLPADTTEENLQARSRGVVLMALSNKTGRLLLTTGNKSEMAVGYATLYGDMAGGFAPLKDCAKTLVYELARYRNSLSPVIPERVITREPSAELAKDQKDSDSLPPYDILDPILERFIEHDQSLEQIVEAGNEPEVVERVARMVLRNEYKRRQAPPGVRITRRGFGKDRRYPITSGYERIFSRKR